MEKEEFRTKAELMRISYFFALVFLGEDYKELIRGSDNKGRKERKLTSLSTGFIPGPVLLSC